MASIIECDERVMDFVADALQRPPEERQVFVRQACNGDEALVCAVNDALAWETKNTSFLNAPWMEFTRLISPFECGEIVAERFEIVREIGEGGMGIVYEAVDRKRHRKIAIKAAKPGFQRLLNPELEGALKVRHPNVCLVNQIHTASTRYGEVDFLSMEFLEGETLAEGLERDGAMPAPAALDVAHQLCLGLAEAHHSGVIHRDLKTSNVILVKNADGTTRAVITDFGLAGDELDASVVAGTPRYIAPELWQGKPASQASDIYALGVILLELIKGQDLHWKTTEDGLAEAPAPDAIEDLPRRWAATIHSCLQASPEARPRDAMQVLAALEKRPFRWMPLAALPLILATSLVSPRLRTWMHDLIWPPPGLRLVVLPPSGTDAAALTSNGALDDIVHRLSHAKSGIRSVSVVSPEEAREQRIATPEQAQKTLHATHAVMTSAHKEGPDTVIQGAVIELDTQTHVRDFTHRYTTATAGAWANALLGEVAYGLGLEGVRSADSLSTAASAPYDRGLQLFQQGQHDEPAMTSFKEAARLDPRSPLPLTMLVEAEIRRFTDTKDSSHLDRAAQYLQAAESLNPDSISVHLARGKLEESTGTRQRALDEYLRVESLAPDNIKAHLGAASAYDKEQPDKAIAEYRKAIELDPTYYQSYQSFGVFYYFQGKYSEAAEQFRKVIELAPEVYRAWSNLSACLTVLGRFAEAQEALQHALQLHTSPDFLENMGTLFSTQGRDAEAIPYLERAVELNPTNHVYRLNLGDSMRRLHHLKPAREQYRRGLQLAQAELQQNPQDSETRAFSAYFAARLGDANWAQTEAAQALHASPQNNRVVRHAAIVYVILGHRDKAIAVLKTATPELLRELDLDPDLADFRQDPRFRQLVDNSANGGK